MNNNDETKPIIPFAEKYPKINLLLGGIIFIILIIASFFLIRFAYATFSNLFSWGINQLSNMNNATIAILVPAVIWLLLY